MEEAPSGAYTEIRQAVAKLCARFPGEYWRKPDEARAYPTEFVQALTDGGYLAELIPRDTAAPACRCRVPLLSCKRCNAKAATAAHATRRCI
jgi:alkylation response protein AidB-like acyl-CoA dehydrogenase